MQLFLPDNACDHTEQLSHFASLGLVNKANMLPKTYTGIQTHYIIHLLRYLYREDFCHGYSTLVQCIVKTEP